MLKMITWSKECCEMVWCHYWLTTVCTRNIDCHHWGRPTTQLPDCFSMFCSVPTSWALADSGFWTLRTLTWQHLIWGRISQEWYLIIFILLVQTYHVAATEIQPALVPLCRHQLDLNILPAASCWPTKHSPCFYWYKLPTHIQQQPSLHPAHSADYIWHVYSIIAETAGRRAERRKSDSEMFFGRGS